jgi:hypothetical protein
MQVTFAPTGENVFVGQNATTPQALSAITSNPIYLDTPAGYTPVQGTMAAGSSAFYPILGTANGHYIGFYAGENKTLLVTKFRMDDATAVTTGLATIAAQLAADEGAIVLDSDGTIVTPS